MWGRRFPLASGREMRNVEWRAGNGNGIGIGDCNRDRNRNVPSGAGQQAVDQSGIERRALQLLHKRGLVEGDTGGERLGNNALTFGDELGGQSGRRGDRVSTSILNRQNKSGASRNGGRQMGGGKRRKWHGAWLGARAQGSHCTSKAASSIARQSEPVVETGYDRGVAVAWTSRQPSRLRLRPSRDSCKRWTIRGRSAGWTGWGLGQGDNQKTTKRFGATP